MANSDIKEADFCLSQESPRKYIKLYIRDGVGSPIQLFSCDVFKTGSVSTPLHTRRSSSVLKSISSLWRWMINPLGLCIMAWSTVTLHEDVPATTTRLRIRNFPVIPELHSVSDSLFKSQFISLIGKTVSKLETLFWVARSTALKVFPESIKKHDIKIPEAWTPTIKKHNNRRIVRQWTAQGTTHRKREDTPSHTNVCKYFKFQIIFSQLILHLKCWTLAGLLK